jgi:hypothetical protein
MDIRDGLSRLCLAAHCLLSACDEANLTDIWILRENTNVVGYALVHANQEPALTITNFCVATESDRCSGGAITALAAELRSAYVQVKASRPAEITSFQRAGYHVAHPTWDGFMIKPLVPEVSAEDAWQLFSIGTDRFLISWLDVT